MTFTILTHAAVAAVAALAAWTYQGAQIDAAVAAGDAKVTRIEAQAAEDQAEAVSKARTEEQAIAKNYQEALNAARTREAALQRDIASARAESDGLREQNADAARRIASAPPAALREYATTVGELLTQCGRSHQELAAKADGHAADVRTLLDAWPVRHMEP